MSSRRRYDQASTNSTGAAARRCPTAAPRGADAPALHLTPFRIVLGTNVLAGGAKVLRPIADQFYGERSVTLGDPFGHVWYFATVKEKLSAEEMLRRMPK
jgi:PhnB protein